MSKGNGNGTWKWMVTTLVVIASIVGGFIYSYGGHDEKVENIEKEVDEVKAEVKTHDPRITAIELSNAEMNRDIYYMQGDIEDIRDDNRAIKDGIDTIIEKMNDEP